MSAFLAFVAGYVLATVVAFLIYELIHLPRLAREGWRGWTGNEGFRRRQRSPGLVAGRDPPD